MSLAQLPKNAIVIPANKKFVGTIGASPVFQNKSRRRRFKMPAKQRRALRAAAKRFKIPILTLGVNSIWIINTINRLRTTGISDPYSLWNSAVAPFTGIIFSGTTPSFRASALATGLLPNAVLFFIKKMGILRGPQRAISRMSAGLLSLS